MSRKNPTEYQRDWQDVERVIREARAKLETTSPHPDKMHRNLHRLIFINLKQAELYCELMRAKELLEVAP